MEEILNILDKEKGNVSRAKIAQMLGMEEKEVADKIEKMEKENVIVGYKTIVNWDKTCLLYTSIMCRYYKCKFMCFVGNFLILVFYRQKTRNPDYKIVNTD